MRKNQLRDLHGRVALVTGASRGAGRAIAAVLGEHGATVYVTGRSVRGQPTTDNLPGTIEDTAEEVTRRGGQGIAVRCDHANESDVEALLLKVRDQRGRLDILVNNAWGGYEGSRLLPAYFWQAPLRLWDAMFERGLKAHLLATYFAIPLMIESASKAKSSRVPGLIVSTIAWDHDKYIGNFYDVAKHSIVRLIWGLAIELRQHRIATVALAPGFMRTERVMSHAGGETDWTKIPWLKRSESPEYLGRAVAALAADARLIRRSGKAFHVGELAREYGFTDTDGRRVPPFIMHESFLQMMRTFQKQSSG
ncbi:MAG TPA: SDR family NAD(P)-dependent oxidoreductase [Candidatus Acidoferrales bacterium]|nr:SDR family NAD(P)-dependent oxidoreductase [Candidatus Acidoferrales bacterium]